MNRRHSLKPGQGMTTPELNQASFAFQGAHPRSPSVLALEGLFTTLAQRFEQLTEVRTDLPDDYLARCKANFTDALLNELERQHYHSPAFDRLITLRDAYDTGTLDQTHTLENLS